MRNSDTATIAALTNARHTGIAPRSLVTITARALEDGAEEQFCFWNGILPVDIEVVHGRTGELETRAFAADGALIKVEPIRLTADLTQRPASFQLNPAHSRVALMLTAYDARLAPVEIHRVPVDPASQLPVAPPICRFRGFVEEMPRDRAATGEHGSFTVRCVSHTVLLTVTNPLKRSDADQRRRSDDRMMRYAAVAPSWDVAWGEVEGTIS